MRVPDTLEKNTIIELAAAGNDDKLYELMSSFNLPDEVASPLVRQRTGLRR